LHAERFHASVEADVIARQARNADEREFQSKRLATYDTERRKLLDAYYAGAVDVATLRVEQDRIGRDIRGVEGALAAVDASLEEWETVLGLALKFATSCATAYARGSERTRRQFNKAVFERIAIRDGRIADAVYREPFGSLFSVPEFEQATLAGPAGFEPATKGL
jgi:hypothetical protein